MTDALREKIIHAGRVLVDEGQGDYVWGHISARLPDNPNRFLMKPGTLGLEEMTADNVITVDIEGERIPVPADKSTLKAIAQTTGGTFHTAASAAELQTVYKDIGTQIGYSTEHRDISWRFLLIGMLLTLSAAGTSLLWAGRLL